MRAKEFITEIHRGEPLDAHEKVSTGAIFTPGGFIDLYRASGIIARCPADSDDIDPYSYVTDRPMIVTYTPEENEIVKDAFKRMGITYSEHMKGPSEEPDGVNTKSPHVSFKGYPR